MAVEKYGTKTDAVVKLVLILFVCLLSFSLGTFVGKKFSDNQHKVAKFEPETQERDVASVHPDAGEVKPTDALTDDEVAKLAEEFVSDDKGEVTPGHEGKEEHTLTDKNGEGVHEAKAEEHEEAAPAKGHGEKAHAAANEHGEAPAKTEKHAPARTTQSVEPMKAAEKVAHGEAPTKTEKTEHVAATNRIPSSLPKEVAGSAVGKYTVQVASYPNEKEAQKSASDLKGKGFSAFYVSAKVKDQKTKTENTWYRVSVGLFTTQKEAEAYKNDLLTRSKVSSAIVQKITE